jgi:hypothetical protein
LVRQLLTWGLGGPGSRPAALISSALISSAAATREISMMKGILSRDYNGRI